jgi:hypothetical protein
VPLILWRIEIGFTLAQGVTKRHIIVAVNLAGGCVRSMIPPESSQLPTSLASATKEKAQGIARR